MASIIARKRKDGSVAYRAQIRLKENGKQIYSETETFSSRKDAKLWALNREVTLKTQEGLKAAFKKQLNKEKDAESDVTVSDLIDLYIKKVGKIKTWGRSKSAILKSWQSREEGKTLVKDVTSAWLIDYAIMRKTEEGAKPATINGDIAILRSVFSVAEDMLGIQVDATPFIKARPTLKKMNLVGKSGERDRRPTIEEISAIVKLAHEAGFGVHSRKGYAPCDKIFVFQLFSGRRIGETVSLLWNDVNVNGKKILVRNMKDPANKQGNDVWVLVPDEAWEILISMPQIEGEPRIFPYDSKTISTRFDRLRAKAGFAFENKDDNLRLHDLRHEALSWLAEKNGLPDENWDIPRIQMVSGHRNWNVLQRYVNLLEATPTDRWKDWKWARKVLD
jgi:integrase